MLPQSFAIGTPIHVVLDDGGCVFGFITAWHETEDAASWTAFSITGETIYSEMLADGLATFEPRMAKPGKLRAFFHLSGGACPWGR